jgi:two-component system response regulator HydG
MGNDSGVIKIMVVDDEKIIREFLARLLSLKGVEVECVEDGHKAIEAAQAENFDFFFLDVRMPKIDGLQTLKQLKKISPKSQYVMMTGYAVDDLLQEAEKEGILAAIKKPFDISQLISFVKDYSREKFTQKEIKILVVDDEKEILNFFLRLLKNDNIAITAVETGREAFETIQKSLFDLVFLDVVLKDMSGMELHSKIKASRPELDIIMMTGYSGKLEQEAQNKDIKGCLYKPFETDKIFAEIEKVKKSRNL